MELLTHKQDRLLEWIKNLHGGNRYTAIDLRKPMGELRTIYQGIPCCRGIFSQVIHHLPYSKGHCVRLRQARRNHLEDLAVLQDDLNDWPI
jgi:hypothetical protein